MLCTNKGQDYSAFFPYHHSVELVQLESITFQASFKLILIITSDGGPDHRVCFGSIQVFMIALFTKLEYACK